jgi:hypothetical protein
MRCLTGGLHSVVILTDAIVRLQGKYHEEAKSKEAEQ